ncbi:kinase-like domain-containing protein [Gigaspora rosea]|uniref:Kinase-like domain-containing protein n=1 Tax=Gigaspora rosea TaxID=44941 RepID=A0A397UY53_9GLOM|nr:kinase-like domain-containing protein [Gigaspora rosea]
MQPSAQNDEKYLSPNYVPSNEQPACDINRLALSILSFLSKGAFGEVYKAEWKGQLVAANVVSRMKRQELKDFKRELEALRKSKNCKEHIIEFFGLSEGFKTGEYILVMQYADSGTLKDYLTDNKSKLKLDDKISLCKDIIKGLKFLHENNIIHRDLHSKNVLIHQKRALLADFGLSKSLLESKGSSEVRGITVYLDPRLLVGKCPHEESIDIYSFGVIMWEIYSCRPPFGGRNGHDLIFRLCEGLRENRQVGMPLDYVKLYEECWVPDPSFRPKATAILDRLEILKEEPTVTEDDIQKVIPGYESSQYSV